MKNKGFVFVETIVIIVVLTIGLVMVYSSFVSILTNNKRRATYNDVAYIYRTYYIEDFITSLNIEDFVKHYLDEEEKKFQLFNCQNPMLYKIDNNNTGIITEMPESEKVKMSFCESLLSSYNVKNIYITSYNINELKKCTTNKGKISADCDKNNFNNMKKYEALYTMDTNMIYYLRTLSGNIDNDYRLIVEYEEEITDPDNTVSKIIKNGRSECPDSYEEVSGICQRKIIRYYYNNIKLVLRTTLK